MGLLKVKGFALLLFVVLLIIFFLTQCWVLLFFLAFAFCFAFLISFAVALLLPLLCAGVLALFLLSALSVLFFFVYSVLCAILYAGVWGYRKMGLLYADYINHSQHYPANQTLHLQNRSRFFVAANWKLRCLMKEFAVFQEDAVVSQISSFCGEDIDPKVRTMNPSHPQGFTHQLQVLRHSMQGLVYSANSKKIQKPPKFNFPPFLAPSLASCLVFGHWAPSFFCTV